MSWPAPQEQMLAHLVHDRPFKYLVALKQSSPIWASLARNVATKGRAAWGRQWASMASWLGGILDRCFAERSLNSLKLKVG